MPSSQEKDQAHSTVTRTNIRLCIHQHVS